MTVDFIKREVSFCCRAFIFHDYKKYQEVMKQLRAVMIGELSIPKELLDDKYHSSV